MVETDIQVALLEPDPYRCEELAAVLAALGLASQAYGDPAHIRPSPGRLCLAFVHDAGDPRSDELLAACAAQEIGVIFYSQSPARARTTELLVRGAAGYVAWPPDREDISAALGVVLQFGRRRLRWLWAENRARKMLAGLSRRERQVLAYMVAGRTNQETAVAMGISSRTVENHRAQVLAKLGGTTISAVKWGIYAGLDLDKPFVG